MVVYKDSKVRERNIAWCIDYFIVSERLINSVKKSVTASDVMGSDHCPILLEMDIPRFLELVG